MDIINTDFEVKFAPRRSDNLRPGHTIEDATAEAHERESRNEAATERENVEHQVAEMPPDDGEGGSWQHEVTSDPPKAGNG